MKKSILRIILLSAVLICFAQSSYGSILIGRITHVEGRVWTYSEDDEDRVEIGLNTPIGAEDGLYTDKGAKAELVFPNDTMLRMGELTEVEVLRIENEFTEVYIRTGTVRAYSHGPNTIVKGGTAMGYVEIPPQGIVDFFADDRSTKIVSLQKDILFHKTVGAGAPETYELRAGSNSLIISVRYVETGTAVASSEWDRWCHQRDMILKEQAAICSPHLPSCLQVYSHELEPYGEWAEMKYRDCYYWFWRPVRVSVGWMPFMKGCWKRWHHDYVWISAEPWGWCTHHYGNWINVHGAWWWTPYIHMGVSFPGISLVNLHIHFGPLFRPFWHPGRVAWISTTSHVGWIPLAPWESYYGWRKWGPRTVVVKRIERPKNRHPINHYAYRDHSLIIPQKEFRRIGPNKQHDYGKLKVTGVKRNTLLRDSEPTYGYHKMAKVKQDVHKGKKNDTGKRLQTITKPNTLKPSPDPVRVLRGKTLLTPGKKTLAKEASQPKIKKIAVPRKGTGNRSTTATERRRPTSKELKPRTKKAPQISTVRPPRQPSIKPPNSTRQSLERPRPEQSARQTLTVPRAQHIKKNTMPSKKDSAKVSPPSKNQQKWASSKSRQKWEAPSRNPILRRR